MRKCIQVAISAFLLSCMAVAQGTPPPAPEPRPEAVVQSGTPPELRQSGPLTDMKKLLKTEFNRAVMGQTYPTVDAWRPLTTREKFHVFVQHTYAPRTFAGAAVDALQDKYQGNDREYERGMMGVAQHYGIQLATSESDVFFERFLIPALLKQDPRYFRSPDQPFFRRVVYSVSRVAITRSDSGTDTFNASRFLGGAASQAISDLYVPGQRQGMAPIGNRVAFDMLRDAGFNLLHEFWPDLRRKVFHR